MNHSDTPTDSDKPAAATAKLKAWPSLQDTEHLVNETVQQILSAATGIVPELHWRLSGNRNQGSCGYDFTGTDGVSVILPHMVSSTPIPDADWPSVLDAARSIAQRAGIPKVNVLVDQPGNHDVQLHADDGNAIHIGTAKAAVIAGETGCRLPVPSPTS